MTGSGQLERAVLQVLWNDPAGVSARDVMSALPGRDLAMTTVLTVLDRLRRKGLAARREDARPHLYFATTSREDYIADIMLDALGQVPDRRTTLTRFLGGVTEADTEHLRRALRRRPPADN
ncbi:MAG: transcriptional regulator [Microbacteriaceae bacterium]|nr:MAG: transcriptional regulator [Microbacteriaceae bacterium]